MRWVAITWFILGGCTSPAGLTVDVLATDGVTRVELFIADDCSGPCPGHVAPPASPLMKARLFEVQHAATWSEEVESGVAGFRIVTEGGDPQKIALLAAVGYAGDEAVAMALLENVEVQPAAADYIRVPLAPAAPLDPQTDPPDGTFRIAQWSTTDAALPSCVVIEQRRGGAIERVAIGPDTDTDCDEVKQQPECAPWAHRAVDIGGSIATANCTLLAPDSNLTCMAAAASCSEVGNPTSACARIAEDYCLTTPLCDCPPWDVSCLSSKITLEGPYIKCIVPTVNISTDVCNNPTTFDAVDVCSSYLGSSVATCKAITIHELGATIGPFGTIAEFTTSKLAIKQFTAPGSVVLEWSGSPSREIALLSMDLDNDRHIVLPLVVEFGGPCSTPLCDMYPGTGQSGLACANTPPASAACEPTLGCDGPMCGGNCCGSGEVCVNDICMCGTGPGCQVGSSCSTGTAPCGKSCCGGTTGVSCDF